MSKFLTENFDFRGHLSTFEAENTQKSRPFKAKNNAQTLPKQLQNNFEKVQKSTFLTPKMAKTRVSIWQKVSIFWSIFVVHATCPNIKKPLFWEIKVFVIREKICNSINFTEKIYLQL